MPARISGGDTRFSHTYLVQDRVRSQVLVNCLYAPAAGSLGYVLLVEISLEPPEERETHARSVRVDACV